MAHAVKGPRGQYVGDGPTAKAVAYEVWGTAGGHGTTHGAARGAFTVRNYHSRSDADSAIARGDWLQVIRVSRT